MMVLFCSKMSPLYIINDWSDINLYFNISKAMCNGQTLYTDVFDHKGPAIFFIYAIGYIISNDTFFGMFIVQCLAWTILSFTAYYTAKLFLDKDYACISALFFLPFFIAHSMEGGSAEEFITVCMAISLYFFIRYFQKPAKHSYKAMMLHGLMWGVVLLTKFNLTIFWVFPLMAIALTLILKKEYKNLIINILFFILGGAIIVTPIILYLTINGAMSDAIDAYITTNTSILSDASTIVKNLLVRFYQRWRFETLDFTLILIGAILFPLKLIKNNIGKIGITASFFALFSAIFMSEGYVYYYSIPYYIYIIPAFTLIITGFKKYLKVNPNLIFAFVIAGVLLGYSINEKNFFGMSKSELFREREPRSVVLQFSKVISKDENPTLLNLGLDNANAIFTYLDLMPNVKYFISPNLTYDRYPAMRDEQTKYIRDGKTLFIVLNEESINYPYFSKLQYLYDNYEVVDSFETFSEWSFRMTTSYLYKLKD